MQLAVRRTGEGENYDSGRNPIDLTPRLPKAHSQERAAPPIGNASKELGISCAAIGRAGACSST